MRPKSTLLTTGYDRFIEISVRPVPRTDKGPTVRLRLQEKLITGTDEQPTFVFLLPVPAVREMLGFLERACDTLEREAKGEGVLW